MLSNTHLNYEMYLANNQRLLREVAQARLLNQINTGKKPSQALRNLLQLLSASLHPFHKAHQH